MGDQIDVFINLGNDEHGGEDVTSQWLEDSPLWVNRNTFDCTGDLRDSVPLNGLPVNDQLILNAFLNTDPESTVHYLDLDKDEFFSLNYNDEGDVDCSELEKRLTQDRERYFCIEPLSLAEFVRVVSEFILRMPDSIALGVLRRALRSDNASFPSEVDALLIPYPEILYKWHSFRDREVLCFARKLIEDHIRLASNRCLKCT